MGAGSSVGAICRSIVSVPFISLSPWEATTLGLGLPLPAPFPASGSRSDFQDNSPYTEKGTNAAITNLFLVVKHPLSGPIHCRRPVLVRTQIPALGGAAQQADAPLLPRIANLGFSRRDMAVRLGKTMKAFSIIWDVDEGDDVCLPSEVEIPADIDPDDEERISDYLSDLTGLLQFMEVFMIPPHTGQSI